MKPGANHSVYISETEVYALVVLFAHAFDLLLDSAALCRTDRSSPEHLDVASMFNDIRLLPAGPVV